MQPGEAAALGVGGLDLLDGDLGVERAVVPLREKDAREGVGIDIP